MGSIDENAITRRRLAEQPDYRMECLADFPLRIVGTCQSLRYILGVRRENQNSTERDRIDEIADYLATKIRRDFEKTFGYDIFEPIERMEDAKNKEI